MTGVLRGDALRDRSEVDVGGKFTACPMPIGGGVPWSGGGGGSTIGCDDSRVGAFRAIVSEESSGGLMARRSACASSPADL